MQPVQLCSYPQAFQVALTQYVEKGTCYFLGFLLTVRRGPMLSWASLQKCLGFEETCMAICNSKFRKKTYRCKSASPKITDGTLGTSHYSPKKNSSICCHHPRNVFMKFYPSQQVNFKLIIFITSEKYYKYTNHLLGKLYPAPDNFLSCEF